MVKRIKVTRTITVTEFFSREDYLADAGAPVDPDHYPDAWYISQEGQQPLVDKMAGLVDTLSYIDFDDEQGFSFTESIEMVED